MSKGSKRLTLRIPDKLLRKIEEALMLRNQYTRDELDTLSDWIRRAINEKLAHLERSRKSKKESNP